MLFHSSYSKYLIKLAIIMLNLKLAENEKKDTIWVAKHPIKKKIEKKKKIGHFHAKKSDFLSPFLYRNLNWKT